MQIIRFVGAGYWDTVSTDCVRTDTNNLLLSLNLLNRLSEQQRARTVMAGK